MPVGGKVVAVCRTGRDSRSRSLQRMVRRFVHSELSHRREIMKPGAAAKTTHKSKAK